MVQYNPTTPKIDDTTMMVHSKSNINFLADITKIRKMLWKLFGTTVNSTLKKCDE